MIHPYFSPGGMAKVEHHSLYLGPHKHCFIVYILWDNAWEPFRVQQDFFARNDAEFYLARRYPNVEIVRNFDFDALCSNLRKLRPTL